MPKNSFTLNNVYLPTKWFRHSYKIKSEDNRVSKREVLCRVHNIATYYQNSISNQPEL